MTDEPIKPKKRGWLTVMDSAKIIIVFVVALLIGMQLGGVPWRYRKQIWQLQGALVGVVAGLAIGRLNGAKQEIRSRE